MSKRKTLASCSLNSQRSDWENLADFLQFVIASSHYAADITNITPEFAARAARLLANRVTDTERGRSSGRRKATAKHAERRAKWEAEIVAAAQAGNLGRVVAKHKKAREAAKEEARRRQLRGENDDDGKIEKGLVAAAGLSKETIYNIARPFLQK